MGEGSLSGWTEGVLMSIAFILIVGLVITNFNGMYDQDNQIGLGTNTTAQTEDFITYADDAGNEVAGGSADFDSASGITLKSSWGITVEAFKITATFITGGWIEDVFNMINLGEAGQIWAKYLRVIWILSLIFAILYILFKVVA